MRVVCASLFSFTRLSEVLEMGVSCGREAGRRGEARSEGSCGWLVSRRKLRGASIELGQPEGCVSGSRVSEVSSVVSAPFRGISRLL